MVEYLPYYLAGGFMLVGVIALCSFFYYTGYNDGLAKANQYLMENNIKKS